VLPTTNGIGGMIPPSSDIHRFLWLPMKSLLNPNCTVYHLKNYEDPFL
jgi:hypothetical protein